MAALSLSLTMVDVDPDLWGRLAYARDWAASGVFAPRLDPYSYTAPEAPWIDHEWGFSWVAWCVYSGLGWPGLRTLRIFLFVLTVGLCFRDDPAEEKASSRGLRALLVAPPLVLGFVGPRAQAFTFLFSAWMLLCFRRSWHRGPKWIVAGVAPMPFWINIHGGFLAGLGIAGLWGVPRMIDAILRRDRRTALALVVAGAYCVAMLPLSPWGLSYIPFMFQTATMSRPLVYEWDAPALFGTRFIMAVLLLALAAYRLAKGQRRCPELVVLVVLTVLVFRHQRHLPFLALGVALCTHSILTPAPAAVPNRSGLRWIGWLVGAAALAISALMAVRAMAPAPTEPHFPARAVSYLKERNVTGGALVDFKWSQYVIFNASPQLRVAFDGRYEAVYPHAVASRYFAWHYGLDGWRELPEDPATRLALVRAGSSRDVRLRALPGWNLEYGDGTASLYVKQSTVAPAERHK